MSELKAETIVPQGTTITLQMYPKSEADKVIAELERKVDLNKRARQYWRKEWILEHKENLHNKYQRCLDKAEICRQEWCTLYYERKKYRENPFLDHLMFRKNRHKEKWLELAKKFKPNSTAQ